MPIEETYGFWLTGGLINDERSVWHISVVDERRMIAVRMDEVQETEDVAIEHLKRHLDGLDPDVVLVHLALNGDLLATSTDPKHDPTEVVYYPPLDVIQRPDGVQTILRSELRELDRLIGNVDLVSYQADTEPPTTQQAVFKYYWQSQFVEKRYDELNIWMRLSHHPNVVPFDRIVLDETRGGVVGFTSRYIPGGTLEDNVSRPFKLKHCKQLMQVVDDLNLRYGIAHQDLCPRNMLFDEATDNIMIFDFNTSAQIGHRRGVAGSPYLEFRDDVRAVIFTVYEMITRDFHFREQPWWELDVSMVQDMEWVRHPDVTLDHPVAEYRALLEPWLKAREGNKITVYTDAPEYIDWPVLEHPTVEMRAADGRTFKVQSFVLATRSKARAAKDEFCEWQRPRQSMLKPGDYLLATGKFKSMPGADTAPATCDPVGKKRRNSATDEEAETGGKTEKRPRGEEKGQVGEGEEERTSNGESNGH